jgi:hypothetical protein
MSHAWPYAAAAAFALLLPGCGGEAPPPSPVTPSSVQDVSKDATSPEGALAAIEQAERMIDRSLGPSVAATVSQSASQRLEMPPAPPPPPVAPPRPTAKGGRGAAEAPGQASGDGPAPADSCGTACGALLSMERATDHLCGLTGESDARCASARGRVKTAASRVHAACSGCG